MQRISNVFEELGILKANVAYRLRMAAGHTRCPRRVVYVLWNPLKEELDRLKKHRIIVPQGVEEATEWYNSFLLVQKANGKEQLCPDPARLKNVLIRPVHRCPT